MFQRRVSFYHGNTDFTDRVIQAIMQVEIAEEADPEFKTGMIAIAHMSLVKRVAGQGVEEFANLPAFVRFKRFKLPGARPIQCPRVRLHQRPSARSLASLSNSSSRVTM